MDSKGMNNKKSFHLYSLLIILLAVTSCKDGNSVFDPDYVAPNPTPVITSISPAAGYLAGVDSVIITGQNFSTDVEEITVNFGGSPGVVRVATETQLIVKPGTTPGDDLPVLVSRRGAEFFSDAFAYDLADPFNLYPGTISDDNPTTPVAVDGSDNIYTIIDNGGIIRYTRIAPDGTKEVDLVKFPGETRPALPNGDPDTRPYPVDSTMRFQAYSDLEIGPGDVMFMTQSSIRAIFQKPFGNDLRETVWAASSNSALKINDIVFDDNGYLWVVGLDSDQIHRFDANTRAEKTYAFPSQLRAVAFFENNNELFVGGDIGGSQQVWKYTINGSGDLINGALYFDFGANYSGEINKMILASNGELLITTTGEESIIRVFPSGRHQAFYEGMLKEGAYGITWRSDRFAAVQVTGDNASLNFMDMYDRTRAGIFGF